MAATVGKQPKKLDFAGSIDEVINPDKNNEKIEVIAPEVKEDNEVVQVAKEAELIKEVVGTEEEKAKESSAPEEPAKNDKPEAEASEEKEKKAPAKRGRPKKEDAAKAAKKADVLDSDTEYETDYEFCDPDLRGYIKKTETQGKAGEKLPRMNLAIPEDVYKFIKFEARRNGLTYSEYICAVMRHRKDTRDADHLIAQIQAAYKK